MVLSALVVGNKIEEVALADDTTERIDYLLDLAKSEFSLFV